jgi:hypothetical protein
MKKDSGSNEWKLMGGPALVISKPDHPAIPEYILNDLMSWKT